MIEESPTNQAQQQVTQSSLKLKATEAGEIQNKPESDGNTIGQEDAIQLKASNKLKILQRKIKAEGQAFRFIFEVNQQSKNRLKPHELAALTAEERLEQTIITLSKQPDRRSLLDHKLIEETLDQFAYIQKMRKYNSNLSKQVAKVLEHNMTPKGKAVFFAGQQPEYFYMILRGKVAVLVRKSENQMTSDKKSGKVVFFPSNQSLGSPSNSSQWRKTSTAVECPNLVLQHQQQSEKHTLSHFAALLNPPSTQEQQGQQNEDQQSQNQPVYEGTQPSPTADGINNTQETSSTMKGQRNDLTIQVNRSRLVSKTLTPKQDNNSKQFECICQGIDLTPAELDEAYKFFENGVFVYNYVKDLTPGSAFGEMGLLLRVPRTATILALEDTDLAVMTKQGYQDLIKAIENFKLQKKIQFFHSVMHQDLKAHELTRITIDFSQKKKFNKGQHIFQEGDSADEVYIINKGDVEFYKTITSEGKTKKAQFSLIGPGELVGVEELFYGQDERYYSAFCQNTVTAYFIQRVLFVRLMHEIPDLKRIMVKRSVNKLKWQQFKIAEVVEQQKIDGLFNKNTQIELHMPQTDQLCEPIYEKIKKRSKSSHVASSTADQNNKNDGLYHTNNNISNKQFSQTQYKKPSILVNNNKIEQHQSQHINSSSSQVQLQDESQSLKISNSRSAQDLMIGFAKKKFIIKESMQQLQQQQTPTNTYSSSSYSPSKVFKTGCSIEEDRIGDAIKNKEKIMQMIERRSTNTTEDCSGSVKSPQHTQFQNFAAAANTTIPSQSNRPSYLLTDTPSSNKGNTWFDLDKKKELEAQIEHAIKQKRTTLKPSHHKIKQKSHDCLIVAADNKHSADISILPASMRKKLLLLNQQRESSQLTEYTNSPADDEAYSPLSPLKSTKNMLSFSVQAIQDQAASQIYFTNSLKTAQALSSNEILPQFLPPGIGSFSHLNNNTSIHKQNQSNNTDHFGNQHGIIHMSNSISCASPTKHSTRLSTAFQHSNSFSLAPPGALHTSDSPKKSVTQFQFLMNNNSTATEISPRRQSQPQLGGQSFSSSNFHIRRMVPHSDSDHKHLTINTGSLKQQPTLNHEAYFNQAIPSLSDIDKYAGNEYQQQMSEVCFSPMSSSSQRRRFTKTIPLRIGTATITTPNNNFQMNNGLNAVSGNENGMSISQLIPTRSSRPSEMLRGSDIFIPSGINSKQSITISQTSKSLILPASLSPKKLQKAAGQQQNLQTFTRNGSIPVPQSSKSSNSLSLLDSPVSHHGFPASFSLETTGGLYFPAAVSRKQPLNTENKQVSPQVKAVNFEINGLSPKNDNSSLRISINENESSAARTSLLKLVKS